MTQLGLGCAQLGMPYGNSDRLMPEEEAIGILKAAYAGGIRHFDSAVAYGVANERILKAFAGYDVPNWEWELATKIKSPAEVPSLPFNLIYLHDASLIGQDFGGYWSWHTWGISVYSMEEAEKALAWPPCRTLQVPVNLLDRRFVEPSFVAKCKAKGVRLIARSILLQGVLADGPLPDVKKKPLLQALREKLIGHDVAMNFQFIFGNCADALDVGLVGVQSLEELQANLKLYEMWRNNPLEEPILSWMNEALVFAQEHKLYDPRTWND